MQCSHLFALTSFSIPATSDEPLVRFGLLLPCKEQSKVVACIFSGYHAVKGKIREQQIHNQSDIDIYSGAALRANWTLFAQTFLADAGELAIPTRAFSVPAFLSFLLSGGARLPALAIGHTDQLIDMHNNSFASPASQATDSQQT